MFIETKTNLKVSRLSLIKKLISPYLHTSTPLNPFMAREGLFNLEFIVMSRVVDFTGVKNFSLRSPCEDYFCLISSFVIDKKKKKKSFIF